MSLFKNQSSRPRKFNRNNAKNYESLEARRMLAATYEAIGITDPFAHDAVTYKQMVDRAEVMNFVSGEVVVAIQLDVPAEQAEAVLEQTDWATLTGDRNATPVSNLMTVDRADRSSVTLVQLKLGENTDVFSVMKQLDSNASVMWSSPNFYEKGDAREFTPNDPDYPNQYHHPLMGNDDAWDVTLGDADIVIAVTDDGVELTHEDLSDNIWRNPLEIPGNGVDDDANGYIDDFNGWDFSSGNFDPNPNSTADSHGTHVSGIAAGDTNNGIGIAGTAGDATIMPLQFFGVNAWTAAVINETFTYAADNGANIVSTSYNIDGWFGDPVFTAGLQYLHNNNVLHLNSAGNGNSLNTARQGFDHTLLVASTTNADTRSSFSNYGTGIDIAAPGSDILSSLTGNSYGLSSGTSMSTPNAAGVAALIWSHNPTWTHEQVAAQLIGTADDIDSLNAGFEGWLGSGRVNSFRGVTETLPAPQLEYVVGLPGDGEFQDDLTIDQFTISFDQIMDSSSANTTSNYDLRATGPDDAFGTADDIVYSLSHETYVYGTNAFEFTIDDGPLAYGQYQLTISSSLVNPFGEALDGDGNGSGGDGYVQEFFLSPPLQGTIDFSRNSYLVEDVVTISVSDANATGPIDIVVVSTGGDLETVTLVGDGTGSFVGTISTTIGSIAAEDGSLQVSLGDELTATYEDMDDGFGGTLTATDTALISNVIEFEGDDTPITISDNETYLSVINIVESGLVVDVDVQLDITHTYDGDLDVFLISPAGTRVELFSDVGGTDENFTDTRLDDEASISIGDGTAPYTGSFRPVGQLADLDLESITGDWTLEVTDDAGGDQGTLNYWKLFIDVRTLDAGVISTDKQSYNPGESIEITVSDANAVAPVVAQVVSSGGDMELVTLTSVGNDMYTGTLLTSETAISAGDSELQATAGDLITITYEDSDDGNGLPTTATTTANITNVQEFPSADIPLGIDDNITFTSEIVIAESGTIADVDVLLDITHTYAADLDVFLIGPDGTRVELFSDVGGGGDNFTQTILDDEAGSSVSAGSAPFTGSYQPVGSLSDFDGLSMTGTWLLEITDDAGSDQGSLNNWSLFVDVVDNTIVPNVSLATVVSEHPEGSSGSTFIDFEIQLSEPTNGEVSVDYATTTAGMNNPAAAGHDFIEQSGTVVFAAGEISKIVSIEVIADSQIESHENLGLILTGSTGGTLVLDSATVQVTNDDVFEVDIPIDFVTEESDISASNVGIAGLPYDSGQKFGWQPGAVDLHFVERDGANDWLKDVMLTEDATLTATFGDQSSLIVMINYGDYLKAHDNMIVEIEGIAQRPVSTAAGEFERVAYEVTLDDDQLDIRFYDGGGEDPHVSVVGILVRNVGRSSDQSALFDASDSGGKKVVSPVQSGDSRFVVTPRTQLELAGASRATFGSNETSRTAYSDRQDKIATDSDLKRANMLTSLLKEFVSPL